MKYFSRLYEFFTSCFFVWFSLVGVVVAVVLFCVYVFLFVCFFVCFEGEGRQ